MFTDKPGLPSNLTMLSKTTNSIYFQWSAPVDKSKDSIVSYIIYYRIFEESSAKKNTSAITSFNLTNLIAGKTYMIHITAKNMFFEGGPSNPISITTRVSGKLISYVCLYLMNGRDIKKFRIIHHFIILNDDKLWKKFLTFFIKLNSTAVKMWDKKDWVASLKSTTKIL